MTYYKIIQNNQVIDAGFVFLKWNERRQSYYIANIDEAQFAQSFDQTRVYRDGWLKPAPNATGFEDAEIVVIDKTEYEEIRALLDDGEKIELPEPEEVTETIIEKPDVKPISEQPMSISEMRQKILEQQEQIAILMAHKEWLS